MDYIRLALTGMRMVMPMILFGSGAAYAAGAADNLTKSRFPGCGEAGANPAQVCVVEHMPILPPIRDGANAWFDQGVLYLSFKGEAETVSLGGELVQEALPKVAPGIWLRALKVPMPERARLRVFFTITQTGKRLEPIRLEVVGPLAEKTVIPGNLIGKMVQIPIESKHLGESRLVKVWLPPGYPFKEPIPSIYIADGAAEFGELLAKSIMGKELPPVIVVGIVACRGNPSEKKMACRSLEYLDAPESFRGDPQRFRAHERFFLEEVIPRIEKDFMVSASEADRAVAGFSSGGDWAAAMALRNPKKFDFAIVMSPGFNAYDKPSSRPSGRYSVTAGIFEPDFVRAAACLAGTIAESGGEVRLSSMPYGHSGDQWQQVFKRDVTAWLKREIPKAMTGLSRGPLCRTFADGTENDAAGK